MDNCQPNCGCKFEVDSACVRYTSVDLGTTSINTGDTVETTIIKIDEAINNLYQNISSIQPLDISGPLNRIVKFGPINTPLLPSQTEDNGTSIGVNAPADPSCKMYIETSPNQVGLKVNSLNNGKEAIYVSSVASGPTINRASYSLASGSTTSNVGSESLASGSSQINIGSISRAIGGTQNFSTQLRDGSETVQGGKFLKDKGDGKANWNYIYLSDIQDYQAATPYVLPVSTSTILGGVKIGSGINVTQDGTISVTPTAQYSLPTASSTVLGGVKVGNGLAIDGQGVLSANIGQGTINYVAKFTPDGYSIDDSQIQDDGTSVGINVFPFPTHKLQVKSSINQTAIYGNAITSGYIGVHGVNTAIGSSTNVGVTGEAQNSTSSNIGGQFNASGSNDSTIGVYAIGTALSSNIAIGLKATATGVNGIKYAAQLKDGTETSGGGKFLRDMGDGKANWADIDFNPQKTITSSYTLTSADNGYSIIVANGATAVTITVPSGLPTSMQVGFIQDGTGDVTFSGSGTTLNNAINGFKIKSQYDQAYLEKKGTSEIYYLLGNTKV